MTSHQLDNKDISAAQQLLERGVVSLMEGRRDEAKMLLVQSLKLNDGNVEAWLWLRTCVTSSADKEFCLRKALNRSGALSEHSYLDEALDAIRITDLNQARTTIVDGLRSDVRNERAWLWLSVCSESEETIRRCLQQAFNIRKTNLALHSANAESVTGSYVPPIKHVPQRLVASEKLPISVAKHKTPDTLSRNSQRLQHLGIAALIVMVMLILGCAILLQFFRNFPLTSDVSMASQTRDFPSFFYGDALRYLPPLDDMPSGFEHFPVLDAYRKAPNGTEAEIAYILSKHNRDLVAWYYVMVFDKETEAIEQMRKERADEGHPEDADSSWIVVPLTAEVHNVNEAIAYRVSVPLPVGWMAMDTITFRIKNLIMQVNVSSTPSRYADLDKSLTFVEIALEHLER